MVMNSTTCHTHFALHYTINHRIVSQRKAIVRSNGDNDTDKIDAMLHLGGTKFDKANATKHGACGAEGEDCRHKEELDEMIERKTMEKVEKMKRKADQGECGC